MTITLELHIHNLHFVTVIETAHFVRFHYCAFAAHDRAAVALTREQSIAQATAAVDRAQTPHNDDTHYYTHDYD